ncbi:MAG: CAP domain-containing protein [Pyrinomonadaceae bacterium]
MKNKSIAKPKALLLALFIALIGNFFVVNKTASSKNYADDEYQIFEFVNAERHRSGLNDLDWDENLARMARVYSEKMVRENFFEHADLNGKTVVDRAQDARIKNWRKIGENLFFCEGFRSFDNVAVRGWMKSPTHRKNILDGDWTATGIGIAESNDGRIYITQVFLAD